MDLLKILPIFIIILAGIVVLYRLSQIFSGSAPRRTKMIRGVSILAGCIIVLVLIGLQIFHVIP